MGIMIGFYVRIKIHINSGRKWNLCIEEDEIRVCIFGFKIQLNENYRK